MLPPKSKKSLTLNGTKLRELTAAEKPAVKGGWAIGTCAISK
jgi:hypothetical protein